MSAEFLTFPPLPEGLAASELVQHRQVTASLHYCNNGNWEPLLHQETPVGITGTVTAKPTNGTVSILPQAGLNPVIEQDSMYSLHPRTFPTGVIQNDGTFYCAVFLEATFRLDTPASQP